MKKGDRIVYIGSFNAKNSHDVYMDDSETSPRYLCITMNRDERFRGRVLKYKSSELNKLILWIHEHFPVKDFSVEDLQQKICPSLFGMSDGFVKQQEGGFFRSYLRGACYVLTCRKLLCRVNKKNRARIRFKFNTQPADIKGSF